MMLSSKEKTHFWKNISIFLILLLATYLLGVLLINEYFLVGVNLEIKLIEEDIKGVLNFDFPMIANLKLIPQEMRLGNLKEITLKSTNQLVKGDLGGYLLNLYS